MDLSEVNLLINEIKNTEIDGDESLQVFKKKYNDILKKKLYDLKNLDPEEKKEYGVFINKLKNAIDTKYKESVQKINSVKKIKTDFFDYSLPYVPFVGGLHLLTVLRNKLFSIFKKLGFDIVDGCEVEDDWHNFTALNFLQDHPARDMQDTFFINNSKKNVLRTHTTSVQAQILEKYELPLRAITIGRVYRNETVSARSNCFFTQFDGFYVDKKVSFLDLQYVFSEIIKNLFGNDIKMRIRPSYFPFTSPSVEVDISCTVCSQKGCPICKNSGWLEVWGGGLIHENVLKNCKVDHKIYSGFAFGGGLERLAMLIYRINDLRMFAINDIRFLSNF